MFEKSWISTVEKTSWKCLGKVLCLLLCVYLLWVYVVLEHKVDGRGSNSAAAVLTYKMDRGKYMKWISESGNHILFYKISSMKR